jgi:Cu+-exporting ATPase
MTCAACSRRVERALSRVPGVRFAGVNLAAQTAFVVADEGVPEEALIGAIRSAGYGVSFDRPRRWRSGGGGRSCGAWPWPGPGRFP